MTTRISHTNSESKEGKGFWILCNVVAHGEKARWP